MAGVWLWLRRDWRARWRSSFAIALLAALTGATVLALLAGVRRTDASLDRMDRVSLDGVFVNAAGKDPGPLRAMARRGTAAAVGELAFMAISPADDRYFPMLASIDGVAGSEVFRGRLLRGRRARPDRVGEVVLAESNAVRLSADVGSRLRFRSLSPAQLKVTNETGDFPTVPEGPPVELDVVGVVRTAIDLGQRENDPIPTILTPAFFRRYRASVGNEDGLFLVRPLGGSNGGPRFERLLAEAYAGMDAPVVEGTLGAEGPGGSITVVARGLTAVAALAGVAGLGWLALALHRHAAGAAADLPVLAALGLGRPAQVAAVFGSAVPGLVVGAVGAVLAAVLASPLLPVGLARQADPDVGVHADLLVLGLGGAVLVATAAAIAAVAARRARRLVFRGGGEGPERAAGPLRRAVARLGPVAATGVDFAVRPGRGPAAVPVRPAMAGAMAGLIGVVGVGVFGASLDRLVSTPARYGAPWDIAVAMDGLPREAVMADPGIEAAALGLFQRPVLLAGRTVFAYGVDPVKGTLLPATVRGRAPVAADEVALGADTLTRAGVGVGDTIAIATGARPGIPFRVVGQGVFPSPDDPYPVADGAQLTPAGLDRLEDRLGAGTERSQEFGFEMLLLRWRPGLGPAGQDAALRRLGDVELSPVAPGPDIARLAQIRRFPQILAAFLVVAAVVAVTHGLTATVRRRRRDLAVLGALGLTTRQRRRVVSWHAATVGAVGVAAGIPLGIAAGRWVWAAVAADVGVATDAAVPIAVPGLAVAGTLVLFALLAVIGGRSAGGVDPATALRAE